MDSQQLGQRVRTLRHLRHETMEVAAPMCGITPRYLGRIERGERQPSTDVVKALARHFGVSTADLLEEAAAKPEPRASLSCSPAIVEALTRPGLPPRTPAAPAEELRQRTDDLWDLWQGSPWRFTAAEPRLPDLIRDVEHAAQAHRFGSDPQARREALRTSSDLYGLLRSYLRRTGRGDLSLLAADRALRAAQDADDPYRTGIARWNIGHILLGQDDGAAHAEGVAQEAIHELRRAPGGPHRDAIEGALHLVAVVAAARNRRWWHARDIIAQHAQPLARQTGEGNVGRMCFGPTNVALHALTVEMMAGETSAGIRLADGTDTSQLPSRERQFTFGLEVARLYDLRGEDPAVLVHLLELETLAPEDLARSPIAATMVSGLLTRVGRTYRHQVAGLAGRLGLIPG